MSEACLQDRSARARSRACALLRFRSRRMPTRPTIWCRRRWSRPGTSSELSARHQSQGVAVHHPAQRILFADAQARPRGAGQRRHHDRAARHPSEPARACSTSRISARRCELLPEDQREAIILIGASGFSYEEAAEICGCAVGTIKSRVSRARSRLQEILKISGEADYRAGRDLDAGDGFVGGLKLGVATARPAATRLDQIGSGIGLADDGDARKGLETSSMST